VEVPRLEAGGAPVSASRVRAALAAGDFGVLESLVPPSTLAFLRSPAAQVIIESLRTPLKGA
jgi:[citrate (pro-3S)-lyase] ligase